MQKNSGAECRRFLAIAKKKPQGVFKHTHPFGRGLKKNFWKCQSTEIRTSESLENVTDQSHEDERLRVKIFEKWNPEKGGFSDDRPFRSRVIREKPRGVDLPSPYTDEG